MRNVLTVLVALMWSAVLLGGAFRPQVTATGGSPRPEPGFPAPPLVAQDLSGKPVALSDLKGQAVFLNFWASWCGPCRLEMPEVQRLAADLPPGTALLTVNMTSQETSLATATAFLQERGYTFPVVTDPQGTAGDAYRVLSLPTSLFIDREGVVVARINGPLSHSAMAGYLKAAGR